MKIYKVGGAVRDSLLGVRSADNDWVVIGSSPEEMVADGFKPIGKDFPVFLHPDTSEEYALARTEKKSGTGYHGFTFYFGKDVTLEEDLSRRDFTINAIAEDEEGNIIDPFNGQHDIKNKLFRDGVEIENNIIEYVAKSIKTNIRELEGAIISLIAQSSFNKMEITIELAQDIVNKFVKNTKREVSIDYIQKVVSEYFQMDISTLQSKTRKRHIVQARQLAMYFAKKFTKASLASIGSQIGKRDHATVLHACKTVDNLSFTDKQFRKYVEDLNQKLTI